MDLYSFEQGFTKYGLEIWTKTLPYIDWVGAGGVIFNGKRQDPPCLGGLAHLIEHAIIESDGPLGVSGEKEQFATDHNLIIINSGSTEMEGITFSLKGPKRELPSILSWLHAHIRIEPSRFDLEKEKRVLEREYKEQKMPEFEALKRYIQRLFLPNGHALFNAETPDSVSNITYNDVANQWRSGFTLANSVLFFIGAISHTEAIHASESIFTPVEHDEGGSRYYVVPLASGVSNRREKILVKDVIGHENYTKEEPEVTLLQVTAPGELLPGEYEILQDTIYGACFEKLRQEMNLVYTVRVKRIKTRDGDYHYLTANCNIGRIDDCEEVMQKIPVVVKGYGQREFEKSLKNAIISFELSDHRVMSKLKYAMQDVLAGERVVSEADLRQTYSSLSLDRIVELTEKIFSAEKCVMVTLQY